MSLVLPFTREGQGLVLGLGLGQGPALEIVSAFSTGCVSDRVLFGPFADFVKDQVQVILPAGNSGGLHAFSARVLFVFCASPKGGSTSDELA